jgi:glutamate-1-semialdehyde 2,1-aminomutase
MSIAAPAESRIVAAYRRRTPTSARLAAEAAGRFPSGVTHDGRYLLPYPIYVGRAAGSRKWDADDNEYVDYTGGHGALLLGHNHPQVVAAVEAQLKRGTHYGACHELELRWAEWIVRLIPSAERVRFTSSGTEATLLALRLARAATGRKKIVHFAGHFHGWHDHVAFGVSSHFDGSPTPGVLDEVAGNVVMAVAQDIEGTRRLLDARDDIAAVIVEPTGASWGQVPVTGACLQMLREVTQRRGQVLVFDEVVSGFRVSPGGAQAHFGIAPDLTTLAKIVAGGLPGGALVGRADLLDQLAFAPTAAKREKVPHQGTFNANPLSAAAGIATLEIVARGDVCRQANDYAARLRAELQRVCRDEDVPWVVYGSFSGFHVFTNPQGLAITAADIEAGRHDHTVLKASRPGIVHKLRLGMMVHGVELFSWPGGPTSAVHTPDDLERTAEAFAGTLRMLKEEGEI